LMILDHKQLDTNTGWRTKCHTILSSH